jgi:hypothetical protein
LVEHDVTSRAREDNAPLRFRQDASYGQLFWAMYDWLVVSTTAERLRVGAPHTEHLRAGKVEVATRLTSHATLVFGGRLERDMATGRQSKSVTVQAAFKTVD